MRSRFWWVMSIIRGIDTRNNVTDTSWKRILQSQPSSRVLFQWVVIDHHPTVYSMFSLWPPSQIVLQLLQPLSEEKISCRARPRAVVLISSEPSTTSEIIILWKLVVKTGRITQSRAQLCHWKIRDCSQSILKHDNKCKLTFAQPTLSISQRILFCWKGARNLRTEV